ncbi:MAG: hypothetical protein IT270_19745 [Saprospiraceae bacterium]|nr:hypothetical protein [Saprospiraceae bacterium]
MEDKLRIFVQQHRQAFDAVTPPDAAWSHIERTLRRLPTACAIERTLLVNRPLLDTAEPAAHIWKNIEHQLDAEKTTDPLEAFIRNNREAFDQDTPDLRVWSNINGGLEGSAPKMRMMWISKISRIAAVLALLITSVAIGVWYGQNNPNGAQAGMSLAEVSDEYAELERYYQGDIAVKRQKLVSYTSNDTETDVLNDLEQMDTIMEELRTELANVPPGNREQVVRAMIENYKAKAAILQRVLERLETQDAFETNRKQNIDNI